MEFLCCDKPVEGKEAISDQAVLPAARHLLLYAVPSALHGRSMPAWGLQLGRVHRPLIPSAFITDTGLLSPAQHSQTLPRHSAHNPLDSTQALCSFCLGELEHGQARGAEGMGQFHPELGRAALVGTEHTNNETIKQAWHRCWLCLITWMDSPSWSTWSNLSWLIALFTSSHHFYITACSHLSVKCWKVHFHKLITLFSFAIFFLTHTQKCMRFNPDATVWVAKQRILCTLNQSLKDVLNYGLFQPASNGRDGTFLDEERLLREYPQPISRGVPALEVQVLVCLILNFLRT